jgi:hypothetical protein
MMGDGDDDGRLSNIDKRFEFWGIIRQKKEPFSGTALFTQVVCMTHKS